MRILATTLLAVVMQFSSLCFAQQELPSKGEFNKSLTEFAGRVYFVGHGSKSQIADVGLAFQHVDSIVADMNQRYGRGNWVALDGGDPDNPPKPDMGHVMKYIYERHGVPVVSAQSDVVKSWGGVDKYKRAVLYVPTTYKEQRDSSGNLVLENGSPKRQIVWGGFIGNKPVGPTAVFLGPGHVTTEMVVIGGGPIASEEYQYALSIGMKTTYVKTEARFPEANGKYGTVDKIWGGAEDARNALKVLEILDLKDKKFSDLNRPELNGIEYSRLITFATTISTGMRDWIEWALSAPPPPESMKAQARSMLDSKIIEYLTNKVDLIDPSRRTFTNKNAEETAKVKDALNFAFEVLGVDQATAYHSDKHPRFNGLSLYDLMMEAFYHSDHTTYAGARSFVETYAKRKRDNVRTPLTSETGIVAIHTEIDHYIERFGAVMSPKYVATMIQRTSLPSTGMGNRCGNLFSGK